MSWLPLHSWRIFSLGIEFSIDSSFLHLLKNIVSVSSELHGFWWEILCDSSCFSPKGKASSLLLPFYLSFVFRSLSMMGLGMDFFMCIQFGVCSASWIYWFTSFGNFSAIISLNTFSALSFSSSHFLTVMTQMFKLLL